MKTAVGTGVHLCSLPARRPLVSRAKRQGEAEAAKVVGRSLRLEDEDHEQQAEADDGDKGNGQPDDPDISVYVELPVARQVTGPSASAHAALIAPHRSHDAVYPVDESPRNPHRMPAASAAATEGAFARNPSAVAVVTPVLVSRHMPHHLHSCGILGNRPLRLCQPRINQLVGRRRSSYGGMSRARGRVVGGPSRGAQWAPGCDAWRWRPIRCKARVCASP